MKSTATAGGSRSPNRKLRSTARWLVAGLIAAFALIGWSVVDRGGTSGFPSGESLRWHDAEPAWSPDGRYIAFVRATKLFSLHVLDTRTGTVRRLTPRGAGEHAPAWSPDSRSIVFVRNSAPSDVDAAEIYRIGRDGRNLTRLTWNQDDERSPVWSPSGERVTYFRGKAAWVLDLKSGRERQLAKYATARWSPDGSRLAVGGFTAGISVGNADGTMMRPILPPGQGTQDFSWSPDGSRLAFVREAPRPEVEKPGLHVIRVATKVVRWIPDKGSGWEAVRRPAWSPDGRYIAYVLVNSSVPAWVHGLYVVRSNGTGLRRLDVPIRDKALSFSWSPDGRQLVLGGDFLRSRETSPYPLIAVDVDGSGPQRLTQVRT